MFNNVIPITVPFLR